MKRSNLFPFIFSGFFHPDVMDIFFCFGLIGLGAFVEDVCSFMNLAALATGFAKNFSYRLPKT
jgi:hypothetical protein